MGSNPLLYKSGLPPFDQIKPEHVVSAVQDVLASANAKFDQVEASLTPSFLPTWDNLLEPLDEIDHDVFRVWSPVGHLMGVMNSDELRKAYETTQPEVVITANSMIFFGIMSFHRNCAMVDECSDGRLDF